MSLLDCCTPAHPCTCKLDMPCLQGLAAQANGEQAEGPCKADRRIIKAKRGKQAPTQQVRLLMVNCSLTWGKLACLLLASANRIAWFSGHQGFLTQTIMLS